jgi:branched-chain amino acid transport system permease protein
LGTVEILDLVYPVYDFLLIAISLCCALFVWWGLNKTRVGKLLIAVIHDREMSMALGINVKLFFTVTFVIGAAFGALGGAVTAPKVSVVPGLGVEVIVLAFAVVVIGGLGSIEGAMIGSVIVGIVRAATVHLLPELELFVIYGVMALVLAFKPHGLFAGPEVRKI